MPKPEALGPASISIGTATSAFMGFLPSFTEVRRSSPDDVGMQKDLRLGQIAATAVAVGTGIIVSYMSGSSVPVVVSILMSVLLIWCYQNARKAT